MDGVVKGTNARYLKAGDWLTHKTSVVIADGEAKLLSHR